MPVPVQDRKGSRTLVQVLARSDDFEWKSNLQISACSLSRFMTGAFLGHHSSTELQLRFPIISTILMINISRHRFPNAVWSFFQGGRFTVCLYHFGRGSRFTTENAITSKTTKLMYRGCITSVSTVLNNSGLITPPKNCRLVRVILDRQVVHKAWLLSCRSAVQFLDISPTGGHYP